MNRLSVIRDSLKGYVIKGQEKSGVLWGKWDPASENQTKALKYISSIKELGKPFNLTADGLLKLVLTEAELDAFKKGAAIEGSQLEMLKEIPEVVANFIQINKEALEIGGVSYLADKEVDELNLQVKDFNNHEFRQVTKKGIVSDILSQPFYSENLKRLALGLVESDEDLAGLKEDEAYKAAKEKLKESIKTETEVMQDDFLAEYAKETNDFFLVRHAIFMGPERRVTQLGMLSLLPADERKVIEVKYNDLFPSPEDEFEQIALGSMKDERMKTYCENKVYSKVVNDWHQKVKTVNEKLADRAFLRNEHNGPNRIAIKEDYDPSFEAEKWLSFAQKNYIEMAESSAQKYIPVLQYFDTLKKAAARINQNDLEVMFDVVEQSMQGDKAQEEGKIKLYRSKNDSSILD